jgi:hypothetical protein
MPRKGGLLTDSKPSRLFLLSPANIMGIRGRQIIKDCGQSDLHRRLRTGGVPLGELFSLISGLYFRGKLTYARAFARAPKDLPSAYVITACGGLIPPDRPVTLEHLREICAGDLDPADARYRGPLTRDLRVLSELAGADCQIVLLGSVATPKYVEPLLEILGQQLLFPAEFVGRGDMSRGGLLLQCVSAGMELTYIPVATAARHGPRPPKLVPRQRTTGEETLRLRDGEK